MLEVTPEDRLWLLRAVAREGAPHDLVAQALVNRWAYLHDQRPGLYPTLAELVRAYAQPINPRWMPGGDLLERRLARLREAGVSQELLAAERQRARRRERYAEASDFPPHVLEAVAGALEGPVVLPRGTLHYHSRGDRPFPVTREGRPGVNTMYGQAGAADALYAVVTGTTGGRIAGLVAVGVGLYAAWRAWHGATI